MSPIGVYWAFVRPFTLLVPATGMVAGALMALGAEPKWHSDWSPIPWVIVLNILLGGVLAAALNGFSNGINQIYDIEVDRINKPDRMLPSGRMTLGEAWVVSLSSLLLSMGAALIINLECLALVAAAAFLTYIYSAPPLRTKSRGVWANITVAIPRGTLLIVCGWSTVKTVLAPEPWLVGSVFGAYFLGAVTTKDFSDVEGDAHGGCRTLPVMYGIRKSIWLISPFFVLPFVAVIPATLSEAFTGNPLILIGLAVTLPLWGLYIIHLLLKTPWEQGDAPASKTENHPSWKHMYLLTLVAQFGFAAAYLLG